MTRPIGLAIRLEPDEMPPHLAELSALGHPELPYRDARAALPSHRVDRAYRRIFCAEPETFAPSAAVAHARLHRRPVAQPAYLYIVAVCESARSCRDSCARKLRRERRHLQGRGMTTFTELECNDVAGGCHLPGHDALMRLETGPAECSGIAAGQAVRPSGPAGRRRRSPRRLLARRARVRWSPSCRHLVRPGRTGRRGAVRAGRL